MSEDTESTEPRTKKLRRMPHIFSQVLELPVPSDFPVETEETETAFTFVIQNPDFAVSDNVSVEVEVVGIVPGAKKVVLRGLLEQPVGDLGQLHTWRSRLPPSANPDASSASFEDGVLTVIVPKMGSCKEDKEAVTSGKEIKIEIGKDNVGMVASREAPSPISVF